MVLSLFNFLLCFLFSPSAFSAPKVYYVAYVARFRFSTPRLMVKGGFCLFLHSLSCCLYFDEHFKNNFGHFCMPFRTCKKKVCVGFAKSAMAQGSAAFPKMDINYLQSLFWSWVDCSPLAGTGRRRWWAVQAWAPGSLTPLGLLLSLYFGYRVWLLKYRLYWSFSLCCSTAFSS